MKQTFDNFQQQMIYINKFLERNTDLKKICQYCGKPAQIKYSKKNPYEIQLICRKCRREKDLDKGDNWGELIKDIPVINLFNHVPDIRNKVNIPILFDDEKEIISTILKERLSGIEVQKRFNITYCQLNKIINKYELYEDSDIKSKLDKIFNYSKKSNIKKGILARKARISSMNNLAKLKIERNISNREIAYLSCGKIVPCHISLICNDKVDPKIETKCTLAEIFEVSVADIFPRDFLFNKIYNYMDYIDLCTLVTYSILDVYNIKKENHERQIVINLAKEFHVNTDTIYKIINKKYKYTHQNLEIILPILINKYNINFSNF